MANPSWPASLPCPSMPSGAQYNALMSDVISTSVTSGAPKVRSASTAVPDVLTCTLVLNPDQVQTLTVFRDSVLKKTGAFDWTDWRTRQPCSYYFAERPSYTSIPGSLNLWKASIKLVTVP